jgi:hypothetical protein
MKHMNWIGWLFAGFLLLQSAAVGFAAPSGNPLEGRLLQDSGGTTYLYHGGLKFRVQLADLSDQVIEAIPSASLGEWDTLLGGAPAVRQLPPPVNPEPFPGYS